MPTFEPATNWYHTRKHWSRDLAPYGRGGRHGHGLCSTESNLVEVWDQAAMTFFDQRYDVKKPTAVDDLPECKKCLRILAKEGQ